MAIKVVKSETKQQLGGRAAADGAALIRRAVAQNGRANLIIATGASQFEMLAHLIGERDVPWHKVTAFHLDEYIDMPPTHPASFRKYLWERFVSKLPLPMAAFHYIDGENDPAHECRRVGKLIAEHPIDVAFVGIGENTHLAFNDPPADFQTEEPYVVVSLDEKCRRQQFGEGWFKTFEDVPKIAISMSCQQIMKARSIIISCPDKRKAEAVKKTMQSPVSPEVPASIMHGHEDATLYLDRESASLIA